MEYALVSPTNVIDRYSQNVNPNVQTKPGWKWLPVEVTDPSFNDNTQIRTGPVVTVLIDKVTRVWTVRDKTSQELTDELNANRDGVITTVDDLESVIRALVLILLDELNQHASKITAILTSADNATTLANFKTAMLAIADQPQRTAVQVRNLMRARLGT